MAFPPTDPLQVSVALRNGQVRAPEREVDGRLTWHLRWIGLAPGVHRKLIITGKADRGRSASGVKDNDNIKID